MILRYPTKYVAFSRGYSSSHKGIDNAWNSSQGGANVAIIAPADGTVVAVVDNQVNNTSYSNYGNYVIIHHGKDELGYNIWTLSAHNLKGSAKVKVGDSVKQGQQIANMNNSGYSFGSHIHFEVRRGTNDANGRVDPVRHCYVFPDNVVNSSTNAEYNLLYYDDQQTKSIDKKYTVIITELSKQAANMLAHLAEIFGVPSETKEA